MYWQCDFMGHLDSALHQGAKISWDSLNLEKASRVCGWGVSVSIQIIHCGLIQMKSPKK
jgi:hypothetical protein